MTNASGRLAIFGLLVSIFATPAFAQDDQRFALLVSFPSPTVSFEYKVNDRFAVRVDGSYSYRDESTTRTSSGVNGFVDSRGSITIVTETRTEATSHSGSIGVAGIITLHRADQFHLYLAPRVFLGFSSQHITEATSVPQLPPGIPASVVSGFARTATADDSSTSPGGGVSFGAEATVYRRLALFGEAGFSYSTSDGPSVIATNIITSSFGGEASRSTFNTRAVGGIKFLF